MRGTGGKCLRVIRSPLGAFKDHVRKIIHRYMPEDGFSTTGSMMLQRDIVAALEKKCEDQHDFTAENLIEASTNQLLSEGKNSWVLVEVDIGTRLQTVIKMLDALCEDGVLCQAQSKYTWCSQLHWIKPEEDSEEGGSEGEDHEGEDHEGSEDEIPEEQAAVAEDVASKKRTRDDSDDSDNKPIVDPAAKAAKADRAAAKAATRAAAKADRAAVKAAAQDAADTVQLAKFVATYDNHPFATNDIDPTGLLSLVLDPRPHNANIRESSAENERTETKLAIAAQKPGVVTAYLIMCAFDIPFCAIRRKALNKFLEALKRVGLLASGMVNDTTEKAIYKALSR